MLQTAKENKASEFDKLLQDVESIPSLPAIGIKIIQEVKKDESSMSDIAKIISCDPALTVKILKVANSSFYSLPYKVESIDRAVNILGLEALKNIALSFIIVKSFNNKSGDKFDHELFWRRSITSAVSASMIAEKLAIKREDMFATPLLMDIGVLVMYMCKPVDYLRVFDEKRASGVPIIKAENAVFGFDHQQVGSEILKRWGIPEEIYRPIEYHHSNGNCPGDLADIVDVLKLADMSSSVYHGGRSAEKFGELKQSLTKMMNTDGSAVDELIDRIGEKSVEILSSFEIDPANMKPYSQILQEANEELGKLNLSYEQLVFELKQEKQKVENLAKELKEANESLRGLAFKDGLTGLFNHRYFQEHMEKEIKRAERYGRTISLIMVDIDFFKKINDTYGHPTGDAVIRAIADLFAKTIRTSDTAARYGGEEFALILPETDVKGAVVLAERLRKMAEQLEIKSQSNVVKITISLGITSYDPQKGNKSKSEVIDAADKALYHSKQTGRNKLSIIS